MVIYLTPEIVAALIGLVSAGLIFAAALLGLLTALIALQR